jgi:hypothetical protein
VGTPILGLTFCVFIVYCCLYLSLFKVNELWTVRVTRGQFFKRGLGRIFSPTPEALGIFFSRRHENPFKNCPLMSL